MEKTDTSKLNNNFENIDKLFNSFESRILDKVKNMVEIEKDILGFELAFSSLISKQEVNDTSKDIRFIRDLNWNKALKKANGNYNEAIQIFSSCDY